MNRIDKRFEQNLTLYFADNRVGKFRCRGGATEIGRQTVAFSQDCL